MLNEIKLWLFKPLYKNALFLIINIGSTSLIGFFFWLIVARVYSDVELGYSSAIISAINLLAILSIPGLHAWVIRFLPKSAEPNSVINTAFTISGYMAIVIAVIFLLGINIWSPEINFINNNVIFMLVFITTSLLAVLSQLSNNVFIACRNTSFTLIKDVGISIAKIILALAFAINFHSFGIITSWGIALAIGVGIAVLILIPRLKPSYKPNIKVNTLLIGKTWKYAGTNYLSSIISSAPSQIFPLMVINLIGVRANAHFYIAWMISNLLFAIPISVSQSLFAEMANFPESVELKRNLFRSLKFVYLLVTPSCLILLAISSWLLGIFGTAYVNEGLILLRLLAISSLFTAFSQVYCSLLQAQDKLRELLILKGLADITILVASFIVLPILGIIGIGYIWASVQFVIALVSLVRLLIWLIKS